MGFMQDNYQVKHPEKYLGKNKTPRYLSSYELQTFRFLDHHPSVKRWAAEYIVLKYRNPVKLDINGNPRICRYIVDLYVEYENRKGEYIKELIEIKPRHELSPPTKRGRKRADVFARQQKTYIQNRAKWAAAAKYAKDHGMQWRILTEDDIFV